MLNAADFGDLLLENIRLFREQPEVLRAVPGPLQVTFWSTSIRTPTSRSICGCGCWRRHTGGAARSDVIPGRAEGASPESITTDNDDGFRARGLAPAPRNDADAALPAARTLKNICCVGDDDQSIYGWRGAEVDNILRFEHDFPGAKVIRLERNYRSTGHILAAASHLIAHNEGRLGKTLRTEDVPGEKVQVTGAWDSEEEARAIGEEIEELQRNDGNGRPHPLDEIAILVRASFQMREFEDRFVTLGLPYRVIGGPRFYERAGNPRRPRLSARRSLSRPTISPSSASSTCPSAASATPRVQMLHDHARKKRIPLTEAARALIETDELKPKPRGALRDLDRRISTAGARRRMSLPHTELAEIVLDESGYTEMWQKDRSADAAGRLENLKELVRSMEEFENLQGFLEHISLVMDRDGSEAERSRLHHDPAFRQGPRIRHRVPARLGGRPVPASARARRTGPRRASRKSAASPMSA